MSLKVQGKSRSLGFFFLFIRSFILFTLILVLSAGVTRAQVFDTVHLMNGQLIHGKLLSDMGEHFRFDWMREGKFTSVALEKHEVFKIVRGDGVVEVVYRQDSLAGNAFTEQQMWDYILGERMARAEYRAWLPGVAGIVTGAAGAYAGFWGIALAPVYLGALSFGTPGLKDGQIPGHVKEELHFKAGYGMAARRMKIQRAAVATLGGLVSMWLVKVAAGGLK
ncbi:MAG TPA: hypothetical protein P5531_10755 [Bacteroidales bacterium]|nr:hypothetical protein [Bacteroidales bacterium]